MSADKWLLIDETTPRGEFVAAISDGFTSNAAAQIAVRAGPTWFIFSEDRRGLVIMSPQPTHYMPLGAPPPHNGTAT